MCECECDEVMKKMLYGWLLVNGDDVVHIRVFYILAFCFVLFSKTQYFQILVVGMIMPMLANTV